jgi:ATP adenylyltransferase/5',5'''-P-1,P-4-tetraphosphate phosphorylase II
MEFSNLARKLISDQKNDWDLARKNYEGLKKVKVKTFDFGQYKIDIQFNPERIVSSAAMVDTKSIEARPCFLCQKNLPPQQRGLAIDHEYIVLVNPFPIFPEHLTIPSYSHTDQQILGCFGSMLDLAERLNDFVIFYNGPKCGASAPDHLHFQAGNKGFLPIEIDFANGKCCQMVRQIGNVDLFFWPDFLRGIITLKSNNKTELIDCFRNIYTHLHRLTPEETEPMLNILALYEQNYWVVHIFPRTLHRPTQYFETGEKQIILSPAAVDMGGVFITPREEDFIKITPDIVKNIFKQVCLNAESVLIIINQL